MTTAETVVANPHFFQTVQLYSSILLIHRTRQLEFTPVCKGHGSNSECFESRTGGNDEGSAGIGLGWLLIQSETPLANLNRLELREPIQSQITHIAKGIGPHGESTELNVGVKGPGVYVNFIAHVRRRPDRAGRRLHAAKVPCLPDEQNVLLRVAVGST